MGICKNVEAFAGEMQCLKCNEFLFINVAFAVVFLLEVERLPNPWLLYIYIASKVDFHKYKTNSSYTAETNTSPLVFVRRCRCPQVSSKAGSLNYFKSLIGLTGYKKLNYGHAYYKKLLNMHYKEIKRILFVSVLCNNFYWIK